MKATRETLTAYILDAYGDEPDYPFQDKDAGPVFRHAENRKWYAIILNAPARAVGGNGDTPVPCVNVKCDPLLVGSLLQQQGFYRAWHMNHEKWITMVLDGSLELEQVTPLVDMSHTLTGQKVKKKKAAETAKDGL